MSKDARKRRLGSIQPLSHLLSLLLASTVPSLWWNTCAPLLLLHTGPPGSRTLQQRYSPAKSSDRITPSGDTLEGTRLQTLDAVSRSDLNIRRTSQQAKSLQDRANPVTGNVDPRHQQICPPCPACPCSPNLRVCVSLFMKASGLQQQRSRTKARN